MTTQSTSQGEGAALASAPATLATGREPDLVLARTHLRLGSLGLARTELETLAGRGALDEDAIRDLAEARWRTGDVAGAGEAASAWLELHPDDVLGLVIAAEAQAALGRPAEARRLAGRAMEGAEGSLDPVFAGMQRSAIWPVEAGTDEGPVGVLFDDLHPGPRPLARPANGAGPGKAIADEPPHEPFDPGVPDVFGGGPSLWGEDADGGTTGDDALDPTVLFHRGRVALEEGRANEAATGLLLALRATPGLAPAVLDLLAGRNDPILVLVRGDAQRLVGREVEAMRDHAAAANALDAVDVAAGGETGRSDAETTTETVASSSAEPSEGAFSAEATTPAPVDEPAAATPDQEDS
jgi:tetratricopeptide (TPR) repeat protein